MDTYRSTDANSAVTVNNAFVHFRQAKAMVKAKGYTLADTLGEAVDDLSYGDYIGILWDNPNTKPPSYLFGLIKGRKRREFIGIIRLNSEPRNSANSSWIIDIKGQSHIERLKDLANEMTKHFQIKITLRVVCDCVEMEYFWDDYDD
jgi:hypothetical protein